MSNIVINNSLSGNTHILLSSGHYKLLKKISTKDRVVDKDGKISTVQNNTWKGRMPVIRLHHEAWHTVTTMTQGQEFLTQSPNVLLMPNNLHPTSCIHDYNIGFVYGLFLVSAHTSNNNIFFFVRKCEALVIKKINTCLATVFQVNNVDYYDDSKVLTYVIPCSVLHKDLVKTIKIRCITSHVLSSNPEYVNGLSDGIKTAFRACLNTRSDTCINMLSSWLSINSQNMKGSKYFIDTDYSQYDEVWDLLVQGGSFIANNITCVCNT